MNRLLTLLLIFSFVVITLTACVDNTPTDNNESANTTAVSQATQTTLLDLFDGVTVEFETEQVGTAYRNKTTVNTEGVDSKYVSYITYTPSNKSPLVNGDTVKITAKIRKQFTEDNNLNIIDALTDGDYLVVTKDFTAEGFYEYISKASQVPETLMNSIKTEATEAIGEYGVDLIAGKLYFSEFSQHNLFAVFLGQDLGADTGLLSSATKVSSFEVVGLNSAYLAVKSSDIAKSRIFLVYEVKMTAENSTRNISSTEVSGFLTISFNNVLLDTDGTAVTESKNEWHSPKKTAEETVELMNAYTVEQIK
ncbi:MAG: hypothetical protein FWG45_00980 [Oscillospiraceae bacterium]|nr:hypothetical protein [Oscillospiraceae bacterium]